jgi:FkbM family methyltransferase
MWWGTMRRPLEATARRCLASRGKILSGPLCGLVFEGGFAQRLGVYELPAQRWCWSFLDVGDLFFDVGAHRGFFSLLAWKRVGPNGAVVACEPNAEILATLKSNIDVNSAAGVTVVTAAVTDRNGPVPFLNTGNSTAEAHLSEEDGPLTKRVSGQTLDSLVRRFDCPRLIKIDVEGYAGSVLRGGSSLLTSKEPPTLLLELHSESEEAECREVLHRWEISNVGNFGSVIDPYPRHAIASPPTMRIAQTAEPA